MVDHVLVIWKALVSTPSTKIKSKSFVLLSKKKILLLSVKTLVVPSDSCVTLFFLSVYLSTSPLPPPFDCCKPDTMVSAKRVSIPMRFYRLVGD